MAASAPTASFSWTPPRRPEWVRALNQEGACLDLDAVVPLDEQSLMDAARARTGLSNFGEGEWYESFRIFIKGLREEAHLNLMGRLMSRADLVNILAARLQIEETYRLHPEIEDEVIRKPIMIVGQARTGTSLLLNMLSQDPDNGSLKHWECMYPCPPPEKASYETDPRIAYADEQVEQWNRVNPEMISCHEFNARVPTEASHAMTLSFYGIPFLALIGQSPTHVAYLQQQGVEPGLRYMRRVLKLLQWKNPRKHWVLKAPDAILYMPDLLHVFPDMNFVWTHRDPVKAGASVINMFGNCMWIRSDRPIIGGVLEQMLNPDLAGFTLTQPIDWMDSGVIPRERVCNLLFLDLERDPVVAIQQLYQQFNMPMQPAALQAMNQYMRDNPRSARPLAQYKAEGIRGQGEHPSLRRYRETFSVPIEF